MPRVIRVSEKEERALQPQVPSGRGVCYFLCADWSSAERLAIYATSFCAGFSALMLAFDDISRVMYAPMLFAASFVDICTHPNLAGAAAGAVGGLILGALGGIAFGLPFLVVWLVISRMILERKKRNGQVYLLEVPLPGQMRDPLGIDHHSNLAQGTEAQRRYISELIPDGTTFKYGISTRQVWELCFNVISRAITEQMVFVARVVLRTLVVLARVLARVLVLVARVLSAAVLGDGVPASGGGMRRTGQVEKSPLPGASGGPSAQFFLAPPASREITSG